jgi:hypothetical protein
MNIELVLSIVSGCLAVIGFIWTYFKVILGIQKQLGNFDFTDMLERIVKIETKMELFWKAVEGSAIAMLHHPTTLRKDDLLNRFPSITDEELCELKDILGSEFHDRKASQDPKLLAYALMSARIDSELLDRKARDKCKGDKHV